MDEQNVEAGLLRCVPLDAAVLVGAVHRRIGSGVRDAVEDGVGVEAQVLKVAYLIDPDLTDK